MNAQEILERNRAEREVMVQHYRDQAAESRRRWRAYQETLPQVQYEPIPDPRPGDSVVLCRELVWAFDGQRTYKAALPGQWIPEDRARALGLDGPAIPWM